MWKRKSKLILAAFLGSMLFALIGFLWILVPKAPQNVTLVECVSISRPREIVGNPRGWVHASSAHPHVYLSLEAEGAYLLDAAGVHRWSLLTQVRGFTPALYRWGEGVLGFRTVGVLEEWGFISFGSPSEFRTSGIGMLPASTAYAFDKDQRSVAIGTRDGWVWVWSGENYGSLKRVKPDPLGKPVSSISFVGDNDVLLAIAGELFLLTSPDYSVRAIVPFSGMPTEPIDYPNCFALNRSRSSVVVGGGFLMATDGQKVSRGRVSVYAEKSMQLLATKPFPWPINSVAVIEDAGQVVVGCSDGIALLDAQTLDLRSKWNADRYGRFQQVVSAEDGAVIAMGTDLVCRLFRVELFRANSCDSKRVSPPPPR